jgi:hypothetical protein
MNSTWLTKHNTTLRVAVEHEVIGRNPSHTWLNILRVKSAACLD